MVFISFSLCHCLDTGQTNGFPHTLGYKTPLSLNLHPSSFHSCIPDLYCWTCQLFWSITQTALAFSLFLLSHNRCWYLQVVHPGPFLSNCDTTLLEFLSEIILKEITNSRRNPTILNQKLLITGLYMVCKLRSIWASTLSWLLSASKCLLAKVVSL